MKSFRLYLFQLCILLSISLCGCSEDTSVVENSAYANGSSHIEYSATTTVPQLTVDDIPEYSDEPFYVINDNNPYFSEDEQTTIAFENYSSLDYLGRCGFAYANICREIMPTEERGAIGQIKPSGWKTQKYDIVDGKYLYNRCHLIGYQLSGENANEENLITGTRYMNVEGMLPFENMVADYVKETDNHVLYRVTPIYDGDNLVASGVQMEALSVEDDGDGICFNVYIYNNQPGIIIDYATGSSSLSEDYNSESSDTDSAENSKDTNVNNDNLDDENNDNLDNENNDNKNEIDSDNNDSDESTDVDYIINKNTGKFHYPSCHSVDQMNDENKVEFSGNRDDLISEGYDACGNCNP